MNYALSYDFIAYRESLNKIGYLGASISGDLAKVCRPPPVTMESAEMDVDLAFKIHGMVASGPEKNRDDVYHVGNRLPDMDFGKQIWLALMNGWLQGKATRLPRLNRLSGGHDPSCTRSATH